MLIGKSFVRKDLEQRYKRQEGVKMQIDHKKVNTLRSFFGVKLRGNETWDELLQIEKDNQERIKRDQENIKRVDTQTRKYFKCRQITQL